MGGSPEVKTSYLGEIYRALIDLKLSTSNYESTAVVNEIDRRALVLIGKYDIVLDKSNLQPSLKSNLSKIKTTMQIELNNRLAL